MHRYRKGQSVSPAFQQHVLDGVLDLVRAAGPGPSGRGGVVAFDLDSTLFDNRPRQAHILREFGAARGLGPLLAARPEHVTSWRMREALRNAGLGAGESERLGLEARAFWRERFFTSDYCHDDHDLPGAARYVRDVAAAGAQVAYVTGRHEAMRAGSEASLARYHFPRPDGARVHHLCKPDFDTPDDQWKERAMALLGALGPVLAAFDNEPAHINVYARAFPRARLVHLATDDSDRPIPLAPGIVSIADFTRRAPPLDHLHLALARHAATPYTTRAPRGPTAAAACASHPELELDPR